MHSESISDFALEICNLSRITEFALKLRINSQSLSQSESSNFSQCATFEILNYFWEKDAEATLRRLYRMSLLLSLKLKPKQMQYTLKHEDTVIT